MNSLIRNSSALLLLIGLCASTTERSNAATINWATVAGAYGTAGNWNPAQLPGTSDLARITNSGIAQISDGNTYVVSNLFVGAKGILNATGTVQITSGTLSIIGSPGTTANNPVVGVGTNSVGRIEVAGGTLERRGTIPANEAYLFIGGGSGKGFLTLSSGNVFVDFMRIGSDQSANTGIGTGQVDVSGGVMIVTNQFMIGRDTDTGFLNITGGEVISMANNYLVAGSGDDYLTVGGSGGSTGAVTIATGGTMRALGGIRMGQASAISEIADGTIRINGGKLVTQRLFQGATTGTSLPKVELNGGTLEAVNATNALGFIYGNVSLKLKSGGITVDSAGYTLPVNPGLLEDNTSPGGGLTKINSGTLRLLGANTYKGATLIQGGGLVLSTSSTGGGSVTADDGSSFGAVVSSAGTSLGMSSLTLNTGGGDHSLNFELGVLGNPTVPVMIATNFTVNRASTVNVTGAGLSVGQITLIQYTTGSGVTSGNFVLGTLPTGVTAELVFEPNAVKLNITDAPSLHWNGDISADWDTTTANWLNFSGPTPSPTTYSEATAVQFDDGAISFSVNMVQPLSPAAVTITNEVSNYTFAGAGYITGATGLRKQGAGILTLGTTNAYTGDTTVSAGTLQLGASEVIPHGSGKGNLILNGKLDLNGFTEGVNGISGAGSIDNSSGTPASLTVGNQGTFGTFSGSITNSGAALTLIKAGNNILVLSGDNGHSGGTRINTGTIQMAGNSVLGSGPLTLDGGIISSDGSTPRTITNAVIVTSASSIGSSVNSGFMTFSGPFDFAGTTVRNLTIDSDALLTGGSGNGALNKLGTATLTIQGVHIWNTEAEVRNGTLVLDNAAVTNTAAFRPDCDIPNGVARLVIGPGSFWVQNATGANLRAGSDGNTTATNIIDIAGTVAMPLANSTSGRIQIGSGSTIGIVNLLTNGLAIVRNVAKSGTGNYCELNLNGGTLQAIGDSATFMQGLSNAFVRAGGFTIDSAGFNLNIVQDLLAGGGNGGLVKNGAGTLSLDGNNTYTGSTIVNGGTLSGIGTIAGPVTITAGGALAPGNGVGTLTINNNVSLQGATVMEINSDGPTSDLLQGVSTLTVGGTLTVTNLGTAALASGQVFNLFDATTFTGTFSALDLPALASGLSWDTANLYVDGTISITGSTGGPQITSVTHSGTTLTLSGSGGTPGASYRVLSSTNLSTPIENWTVVETSTFDGSGNFTFNGTLNTGTPQEYYVIAVP